MFESSFTEADCGEGSGYADYFDYLAQEQWSDADVLERAGAGPAGVQLLLSLLQVDPSALTADQAVTYAQQVDRIAAFVAGFQARARAGATARLLAESEEQSDPSVRVGTAFVTPHMLAAAELAAALRVSPRSMDAQLRLAADLDGPMLALREGMLAGELSASHAASIARELERVPYALDEARAEEFAGLCARVLAVVVPFASAHTPGQCARRTRSLVLAADPAGLAERRQAAAEREHGVWLTPTEPGTCEFTAVLPLEHGRALLDAITALAGDERFETGAGCVTAGQRRVAALTTLVLGDPGRVAAIDGPVAEAKLRASVSVVVPLATSLGVGEQGGTIGGTAVDAAAILEFLAGAAPASTIRRLVVDAEGCIVDAGRRRYAVTDLQRQVIALRDGTCRFPGCARKAQRCEIDHAIPWDSGGATDLDNLGALCKHHHQLKTFGGWRITSSVRAGACTWRSPVGRIYEHRPADLVPPPPMGSPTPQSAGSSPAGRCEPPPF